MLTFVHFIFFFWLRPVSPFHLSAIKKNLLMDAWNRRKTGPINTAKQSSPVGDRGRGLRSRCVFVLSGWRCAERGEMERDGNGKQREKEKQCGENKGEQRWGGKENTLKRGRVVKEVMKRYSVSVGRKVWGQTKTSRSTGILDEKEKKCS